jgi:hypothetical protein
VVVVMVVVMAPMGVRGGRQGEAETDEDGDGDDDFLEAHGLILVPGAAHGGDSLPPPGA